MEPVDIQRDSLLRTRQAAQERAAPLARAVLVARYSLEKEALTEAAAEWLGAGGTSAGRACTGAFLFFDGSGYSKVVLVVIEGSIRDVEAFLGGAIAARLQDARVLCVSDDLAKRAWPALFFTASMPAAVAPTELMDAAEVQSSVGSFAINVARLGRSLGDGAEADDLADSVRSAANELQPPVPLLLSALGNGGVFTLSDYAAKYFAPTKLNLPSDKVWPAMELKLSY